MKLFPSAFFLLIALTTAAVLPDLPKRPIHLEGVVTSVSTDGTYFFMRDEAGRPWRVGVSSVSSVLKAGDRVELEATTERDSYSPRIFDAEVRRVSSGGELAPVEMSIADLYDGVKGPNVPERDWYAEWISIEGTVSYVTTVTGETQIFLSDGQRTVQVSLNLHKAESLPDCVEEGAVVRATGVALYTMRRDKRTRELLEIMHFNILVDSPSRLSLVKGPPWWTARRLLAMLGAAFLLVLLALFLVARNKRLRLREAEAVQRERLRLSHDLHDNIQQLLAGSMFRLDGIKNLLTDEADVPAAREQLAKAKQSIAHAQTGLRSVLWGLTEESEGPSDMEGLFRYAASRLPHWEGRVKFSFVGDEPPYARALGGRLLMIMQEAVGNALRHARARKVEVSVEFCRRGILMQVRNDGLPLPPDTDFSQQDLRLPGHYGLEGMRERAREVRGRFKIEGGVRGTCVTVTARYAEENV